MIVDALDTEALRRTVIESRPDVVINQLTNLPEKLELQAARSDLRAHH